MTTTYDIAERARARQFYYTPYRTGNLARSIGVVKTYFTESHYQMFDEVFDAKYGKILNEARVIKYATKLHGKTYTGSYVNKHYQWVNRYVAMEAYEIDSENGTIRG